MPNTTILPINVEGEPNDGPKKFTNIDKEDFEFSWDSIKYTVKAGETVSYPKYLVNYAAMHLARKIVKREAFAKVKKDVDKQIGLVRFINPEEEGRLQKEAVRANFTPEEFDNFRPEIKIVKKEEKKEEKK